ncbi:MAG: asparagine synthase (glutamine-hydrolyzing), partial [Gemmatimonadota bacterium]
MDALAHRGPDGRGRWISQSGEVALGHTRLAIIDPVGGTQPLANEDGRIRLTCNGDFYGYREVRQTLEQKGHTFRAGSDSEVALHLYEDHGRDFVHHLRGQFAFVLWDEREGTLLAVRDRLGIKPLFFAEVGDTLLLASEAKALFAVGVRARWDLMAVYQLLHACPRPSVTMFAGVRQIPPGHMLVSTPAGYRLEKYWEVPNPPALPSPGGEPDAALVKRVRDLVTESVRTRLQADVPVGCLLSGGLDSSSILGIAGASQDTPVGAFTVGFDDADFDESPGAAEAARFSRADHHVVAVTDRVLADHFHDAVWHAETVQYNAHGTARFLLSRAVRDAGYKSVLAGEGADELFYGYEFTRAAARVTGSRSILGTLRMLPRLMRSPRRRYPGLHAASPWMARLATLLDVSPALLRRLTGGLDSLHSLLSPEFMREFGDYDVYHDFYQDCDRAAGISAWPPGRQLTYLWLRSIFANYHLAADRLDMAHGVEVRFPFLDHALLEFLQQQPLDTLANAPREKHL